MLRDKQLLIVSLVAASMKNKIVFAFLRDLDNKFRSRYSEEEIRNARDYDMAASFADLFRALVMEYNSGAKHDSKDLLQKQLDTLLPVMSENIDKLLQNHERVVLIVKQTEKVHTIADQIKRNASMMKKDAFCKRNLTKIVGAVLIVGIIVAIIVLF